jgi:long-subunit fatty acid transport protein
MAFSWGEIENYGRPLVETTSLDFDQRGRLQNVNLSFALKLSRRIAIGLGLNYAFGTLDRDMVELLGGESIFYDTRDHRLSGFYVNGGLSIDLSPQFRIAFVFRTPYRRDSKSSNRTRFLNEATDTDIRLETFSNDTFMQPLVIGLGFRYAFTEKLLVTSDLSYFNWSSYEVDYFGELLPRDFRSVVRVGVGIEFWNWYRFFRFRYQSPIRFGIVYDPQPMREPQSDYWYLSLGTGFQAGSFFLDVSLLVGKEWGSGDGLTGLRLVVTAGYKR